jgi:predicted ATP-grasp superfamily ATP-dependent carboligase
MHLFVYEWATGGGLVEEPGSLPAALVREGTAMIAALAADLARIEDCQVTALRDARVLQLALPGCELIDVDSAFSLGEEFERRAAEADGTVLIAPEFDGILLKAAQRAAACGAKLFSPSPEFVRATSNKQQTCDILAAAGVATPHGVVIEADASLPANFSYPAVLKPLDGAGSQDTYLVTGPHDAPPAYPWSRRLERYVPGLAASVAMLCGPEGHVVLAPCKQRISDDGRFRYLGGELPIAAGLAERAKTLAMQALAALPPAFGYVGIDLVLGSDPHGSEDAVIEVNPRLTTSYVGLRAAAERNLAKAMILVAAGNVWQVDFSSRPLEFDSDGNVSFMK